MWIAYQILLNALTLLNRCLVRVGALVVTVERGPVVIEALGRWLRHVLGHEPHETRRRR